MPSNETRRGLLFALAAYFTWGLAPLYFKLLEEVGAAEIIAHRIVWSLMLLGAVLLFSGSFKQVSQLLPKLPWLLLTALLISTNWLVFVWAINAERISETSLGYYINPLVSVLLARLFLREKLRPLQGVAFALAALGVMVRLFEYGQLPWVALVLAFSFGFYGLLRKQIHVSAVAGLMVETLAMSPFAIAYLWWLEHNDALSFLHSNLQTDVLLAAAGLVTTVPLICFAAAVVRLSLVSIGILQYIAPSMSLVIAVLLFGEPFSIADFFSFLLIWLALVVFTWDSFRWSAMYRQSPANPVHLE
jgi:chloramphenicol-sensitive protein RarD